MFYYPFKHKNLPRTNLQLQQCCKPAHRLLREAEMPLELAVGQGEGIIPEALHARQIPARRRRRHILNRSSVEEMENNDVVERFHAVERIQQD